jgi:hypothetical protein
VFCEQSLCAVYLAVRTTEKQVTSAVEQTLNKLAIQKLHFEIFLNKVPITPLTL